MYSNSRKLIVRKTYLICCRNFKGREEKKKTEICVTSRSCVPRKMETSLSQDNTSVTMKLNELTTSKSRQKLKCVICQNYLSFFPITFHGNKLVCGRCVNTQKQKLHRNEAYETVSQWIRFPCIYETEGCSAELFPREVPHHENICPHKLSCPLVKTTHCKWKGQTSALYLHCLSKHSDLSFENLELDLTRSHEVENLLEHKSELLILVRRKFDIETKLLKFSLQNLNASPGKKYSYHLTFTSGDRNFEIKCTPNRSEVVFDTSQEKLSFQTSENSDGLNEEMLSMIKCSDCKEFALPPIYQFGEDVKCFECREKIVGREDSVRNFNLDSVANMLTYPCKYKKNGCDFFSKAETMKAHLNSCEYKEYECVLRCQWRGMEHQLENHLRRKHNSLFFKRKNGVFEFTCPIGHHLTQDDNLYIITTCNRLFRFCFYQSFNKYYWQIELLGQPQESFKYKIVITNRYKTKRLVLEQTCCPQDKELSRNVFSCYFFHEEIVHFLDGNSIKFVIIVHK